MLRGGALNDLARSAANRWKIEQYWGDTMRMASFPPASEPDNSFNYKRYKIIYYQQLIAKLKIKKIDYKN